MKQRFQIDKIHDEGAEVKENKNCQYNHDCVM